MTMPKQHHGHYIGPVHAGLPAYESADLQHVLARLAARVEKACEEALNGPALDSDEPMEAEQ